jgi:glycerol-3-phosphate dehydrogenase
MAEAATDHVCSKLGVDAECTTAILPEAENPVRLDAFVERYDAKSLTDADIVERGSSEVD